MVRRQGELYTEKPAQIITDICRAQGENIKLGTQPILPSHTDPTRCQLSAAAGSQITIGFSAWSNTQNSSFCGLEAFWVLSQSLTKLQSRCQPGCILTYRTNSGRICLKGHSGGWQNSFPDSYKNEGSRFLLPFSGPRKRHVGFSNTATLSTYKEFGLQSAKTVFRTYIIKGVTSPPVCHILLEATGPAQNLGGGIIRSGEYQKSEITRITVGSLHHKHQQGLQA